MSTAEAAAHLVLGDEYVDLEQLGEGVHRATGVMSPLGRLLPRSAVHEDTWSKILTHLSSMSVAVAPPG